MHITGFVIKLGAGAEVGDLPGAAPLIAPFYRTSPLYSVVLCCQVFTHCPDNIPPVGLWRMGGRFCDRWATTGPPVAHQWPTSGFWLYNQQFSTIGTTVAFQSIFMSVEIDTGGPIVVIVQDGGEQ